SLPKRLGGFCSVHSGPPLDFNEREPPPPHRDQIDLASLGAITPGQNPVSLEAQDSGCDELCPPAHPLALPPDSYCFGLCLARHWPPRFIRTARSYTRLLGAPSISATSRLTSPEAPRAKPASRPGRNPS